MLPLSTMTTMLEGVLPMILTRGVERVLLRTLIRRLSKVVATTLIRLLPTRVSMWRNRVCSCNDGASMKSQEVGGGFNLSDMFSILRSKLNS